METDFVCGRLFAGQTSSVSSEMISPAKSHSQDPLPDDSPDSDKLGMWKKVARLVLDKEYKALEERVHMAESEWHQTRQRIKEAQRKKDTRPPA